MSEHMKSATEGDVTDAFAAQCKIVKTLTEAAAKMSPEELVEFLSPQYLSSINKFIKDNEMRIHLSDSDDAQELSSHLDEVSARVGMKLVETKTA